MPNIDLEDVITSSLEDAVTEPLEASTDDVVAADDPTPTPEPEVAPEATSEVVDVPTTEVASPGAKPQEEEDEFLKKYGIPSKAESGRENRVPHSRVQKIVAKAEKEAVAKATKEFEAKFAPQLAQFQTKVSDYEGRLVKVAEFEKVMTTQPKEFLTMLSGLPAYKEFFDYVNQIGTGTAQPAAAAGPAADPMPQPNHPLGDGSMVYDEEGLQKLLDWQARNIEGRLSKTYDAKLESVTAQYAPIRQQYEAQQHLAKIVPVVEKQITDARTWPQFVENEPDIVKALQADANLSLEGAYRQVVFPKIVADRDTMRKSVLEEIRKTPSNSGVPTRGASRPTQVPAGPRSMEDVIADSIAAAGLK